MALALLCRRRRSAAFERTPDLPATSDSGTLLGALLADGAATPTALTDGFKLAFTVGAGFAVIALVATLYVGSALFIESYPQTSPWSYCEAVCPDNAFLLGSEPAWLGDVVVPIREVVTIGLFLAVTVRVGQRVSRSTPITRTYSAEPSTIMPLASVRP